MHVADSLSEDRATIDRIAKRLHETTDTTEWRTGVGRLVSNTHVKLDHTFEDVATPHHPGADVIDGRSSDGHDGEPPHVPGS